jgi:tripartite-type tricarboxylate transporter receptor subunit TctC
MRRVVIVVAYLLGAVLMAQQPARAEYPDHPVRVIIPFTPGGAPDVLLRMVAQKLSEEWGQSVVVDNRPGGNTLIGTVAAAKAPPDGHTLLLAADQSMSMATRSVEQQLRLNRRFLDGREDSKIS